MEVRSGEVKEREVWDNRWCIDRVVFEEGEDVERRRGRERGRQKGIAE